MTVLDIIRNETDIAEYIFFDRNGKFLSFNWGRYADALLYGWGNRKVIEYSKYPYYDGTQSCGDAIIRHLNGENNHIMYVLKITLDVDVD